MTGEVSQNPVAGRQSPPEQADQPPLDVPQRFEVATSHQVRDALQEYLERDLLGPWDGEQEVLPPRSQGPGERYLVGRLGPRHEPGPAGDDARQAASVGHLTGGFLGQRGSG